MSIHRLNVPDPWRQLDTGSQERLARLFGVPVEEADSLYESERRKIEKLNEIEEIRAAEAEAAMERMFHVPTLEERAWALARARHREERQTLRPLELGRSLDEHYRRAYGDITFAEKVLRDTTDAVAAETEENPA